MTRQRKPKKKVNVNLRFNILTILIYVVGIVLIVKLFTLQIVNGAEYREQSNTRLTRESILEPARGEILDRSGNTLVTSGQRFNLELYKSKIDTNTLNDTILKIVNVLEKYQVSYKDDFPIKINPFEFSISNENSINWKKNNDINENTTAEEVFYKFKNKYKKRKY